MSTHSLSINDKITTRYVLILDFKIKAHRNWILIDFPYLHLYPRYYLEK